VAARLPVSVDQLRPRRRLRIGACLGRRI
jgi:hypothetical protein